VCKILEQHGFQRAGSFRARKPKALKQLSRVIGRGRRSPLQTKRFQA
jgi:hypothetical protein